jgi:predicted lysophospholipase L1 biosynthesis ABC-type transport system permease subunit
LSGTPAGLSALATVQAAGGPTSFGPADVPTSLPAVVTGSGSTLGVGLDGSTITLHPIATVAAVPGAGSGAALVDLTLAQRLQSGPQLGTSYEVWLAPGASERIVGRLGAEGIKLVGVQTAAARDASLAGTGISLAYSFFLLAALAAGLLAVGATIFALVAAARRRVSELAALQAVGIRRSSLRRSLMAEQGMVVGCGVVLGLAAGVAAAVVALPSVPEFVSSSVGPPLDYGLPFGILGLEVVALGLLMAATVGLTARAVLGQASMEKVGRDQS